jgi:cellulose synthase/poly-beta-1,6-N-acetylglucosamine synthase-like glycosyltransferase
MNILIFFALSALLLLLSVPTVVFVLECLLGVFASKARRVDTEIDPTTVILVPAHNEAGTIGQTLENLQAATHTNMRVLVVADNCSDETADVVRSFGMEVIERHDESLRGKGYALDFGLQHLRASAERPEVVIVFDADCFARDDALGRIAREAYDTQRPIQSCYLMLRGDIDRISIKFSEFAFFIKNKIRMRGANRLGMPVPLTGTGMAFPWKLLAEAKLATGDIVEDMRLGVELAEAGSGALYSDSAAVYSYFPQSEAAEKTQKTRWEHGHLNTITTFVPRLLKSAINKGNTQALGMALDLSVPPFTLLLALLALISLSSATLAFFALPFVFVGWSFSLFMCALICVALVWFITARDILHFSDLIKAPLYIFSKLFIYVAYMFKRQTEWVRTKRD